MLYLLHLVSALLTLEDSIEHFNNQIHNDLNNLATSNHFAIIKMAFTDKCPLATKKCTAASCDVPKIKFEGKDGHINLNNVIESYSPAGKTGGAVWKNLNALVSDNITLKRILSGLNFSVTTHLTSKYTKIFNYFFSNPRLFKKKYNKEQKDNFLFLYSIIRAAISTLPTNPGEINEQAKALGNKVRRLMRKELELKKEDMLYQNTANKKALLDKTKPKDIENEDDENILEISNSEELFESLPKIEKEAIEVLNEMVKYISCLECDKCKLWGTIQTKGIKSAVKTLNGMPLFKNEVIFLVNLFRQLSYTVIENKRMLNVRLPILNVFIICHRQILMILMTSLVLVLVFLKFKVKKHIKTE